MAYCQYCGEKKKLIKAHIIPEAFWRAGESSDFPFVMVSNTEGKYPKRLQIGAYDPSILCGECDRFIGNEFDQYAAEQLLQVGSSGRISQANKHFANIYKFDEPQRIKRFFVSLLWRAHISARDEFDKVRLGKYAELAKSALHDDDALSKFDVILTEWKQGNCGWLSPHLNRLEGINTYKFSINRFVAYIKVDRQGFLPSLREFGIDARGDLTCLLMDFDTSKEKGLIQRFVTKYEHVFRRYFNK